MIFNKQLNNEICTRHRRNNADSLLILGGYIGLNPVKNISKEGIYVDVVYGASPRANFNEKVHDQYVSITQHTPTKVYYSNHYYHSKIYCWIKNNTPIDILVGSANFSASGLDNDYQEFLTTIANTDFEETFKYMNFCLSNSTLCNQLSAPVNIIAPQNLVINSNQVTQLLIKNSKPLDKIISHIPPKVRVFCGTSGGEISSGGSGPNWGHGKGNTNPNDWYQRLGVELIKSIPELFPNNGINPNIGKGQAFKSTRQVADGLFDDGEVMKLSFEQKGPSSESGQGNYYKALTSWPNKSTLGTYLRKRLKVPSGSKVDYSHFLNYGRDCIDIEKIDDGQYYLDFSSTKPGKL
ncbi:MAG: NgoFVII family restriction endonuclease [Flavobacteriaceae bacterium]|nr:NgoFVII family restriction endonuclease [Flavobacteriaceae bacterium]